ncbi:MAG: 3-dehydroquinate synthase [Bacteroidales bacterium]|nr:3-dehydroquinate synthase [Bacteroidales bacterium]
MELKLKPNKIAIIADQNVLQLFPYYIDTLGFEAPIHIFSVLPGEQNKSIEEAVYLWQNLMENHFDKRSLIINFGGGMVSDLGGFVASTYQRGIPFINIPTTLLGMIDAAVGGKNAINLNGVKNVVGTVSLPEKVVIDTLFLKTLSPLQILDGFGEMLKYALIGNISLWNEIKGLGTIKSQDIKKEWIDWCVSFKEKIVQEDLYDKGLRHILNFGHTMGHAIEAYFMQKDRDEKKSFHTVSHGHAVALGMVMESYLSYHYGLLSQAAFEEIQTVLLRYYKNVIKNFPASQIKKIVEFCLLDKKNVNGRINITMLESIGKSSPNHFVSEEDCAEAIKQLFV